MIRVSPVLQKLKWDGILRAGQAAFIGNWNRDCSPSVLIRARASPRERRPASPGGILLAANAARFGVLVATVTTNEREGGKGG